MKGRDLRVTLKGGRAVAAYTAPFADDDEDRSEVDPQPAANPINLEPLDAVQVLEQWLRKWEWIAQAASRGSISRQLLVPDTFRVLGDLLWQIAFSGDVGTLLRKAMAEARQDDSPLRVRIGFGEGADELARLPWEFLRCPEEDIFLAQSHSVVFGRFVDGPPDTKIVSEDRELRVMFVIALPTTDDFAAERDELRQLVDDGLRPITKIDLRLFETWDRAAISAALIESDQAGRHIDVLHLVAVCTDEKLAPSGLPMMRIPGAGLADPKPILASLTSTRVPPTLVVLHLGEGDTDPAAHFEMLAPAFIRKRVPAVLAMQYPMPPTRGREFLSTLYLGLAGGQPVGSTIHEARALLAGDEWNRQFGTPVLYLQSLEDGRLLKPSITVDTAVEVGAVAKTSARGDAQDGAQTRTAKALTGAQVAKRLAKVLEYSTRPDPELQSWLQRRRLDWPDDLALIADSLRAQQRQRGDNREVDRQLSLLLAEVARMQEASDG
jgi:hypothetical protein